MHFDATHYSARYGGPARSEFPAQLARGCAGIEGAGLSLIAKLATTAGLTTVAWMGEYGAPRGADLPIYHWWLSDLTRFLNSFASSFVDYSFGVLGFVFPFIRDPGVARAVVNVLAAPVAWKDVIDATLPLDAWRYFQWDNKLANWLGHFAFTILVVWLVSAILRWRRLSGLRFALAIGLLLPFGGVFILQWVTAGTVATATSTPAAAPVVRTSADNATQGHPQALPSELITNLKTGHMLTCTTAIKKQSELEGLRMSDAQIERHCRCVGDEYFDAFSQADFELLLETFQLPAHVLERQEDIQASCFDKSSQQLPSLVEIIVAGDNQLLRAELQGTRRTPEDLGNALVAAAGVNNVEAIAVLLAEGAPLDYAILQRTPLIVAVTERNEDAVKALLDAGADPNYVSTYEWRPLHYAINAESASSNIIELLVAYGADPDARTNLGITPLHRAAGFCHADAVLLLRSMSAGVAFVDDKGHTAAQRAILSGCPDVAASLQ